jgi:hypothetical protein
MPVGTGIKREKLTFQQVLLQLSPFYWQGDASWAWNTKVPLWTGACAISFDAREKPNPTTFRGAPPRRPGGDALSPRRAPPRDSPDRDSNGATSNPRNRADDRPSFARPLARRLR